MNYDVIALMHAAQETRYSAQSALPDAPVVADFLHRREPVSTRIRRAAGNALIAAADRIAPEPVGSLRTVGDSVSANPGSAC
jgi:hypothetical protein